MFNTQPGDLKIYLFLAPWLPYTKHLLQEFQGILLKYQITPINVGEEVHLPLQYSVKTLPTLLIDQNGIISSLPGFFSLTEALDFLESNLDN